MKVLKVLGAIAALAGIAAAIYYAVKKYLGNKDCCSCEDCEDFCCFDEETDTEEKDESPDACAEEASEEENTEE